jgi:hypothetical protein
LRVPAATKHELLVLIDRAVADGWDHRRACRYLELGETRAWRWRERRAAGTLEDAAPGGHPVHAITPEEEAAIVRVFEEHQLTDRSHRKLAHRGSYLGLVWVSESRVRRVLAAHELRIRAPRRAGRSERSPFPAVVALDRLDAARADPPRDAGACLRISLPRGGEYLAAAHGEDAPFAGGSHACGDRQAFSAPIQ